MTASAETPQEAADDWDDLSAEELAMIDQAWENHKAAVPVATVINDNQPGRTAIIEILSEPPTLPVGTKLYAEPKRIPSPASPAQEQVATATPMQVKPLEWVKHPSAEMWRADGLLGTYYASDIKGAAWALNGESIHADTLEDAKAAANTHNAEHIGAWLVTADDRTALLARIAELEAREAALTEDMVDAALNEAARPRTREWKERMRAALAGAQS